MRRNPLFFGIAGLAAALTGYVVLTAPPAGLVLSGPVPPTFIAGAYHIHSARSDGTGTVDEIAAAAARAGLQYIVITDHGDAMRPADPPQYRHGVLCIDAAEISTDGGHVVALGLRAPAPYPLAGQPRDVIDDIHRLGGKAVAAHPDSPKPALRWRGGGAGFDGIEWLNADSEWRHETPTHLIASALRSFFREPEVVASIFSRPTQTLQRWDSASRQRPVFGLAAVDAHARIPLRDDQSARGGTLLARPSYEGMFRALDQVAVLDAPLDGQAEDDSRRVLDALTTGRSFSIVRAFGGPATLTFSATQGAAAATMGERIETTGETTFEAVVPQAPAARVALVRDGREVSAGTGRLRAVDRTPGVFRIEVTLPGHDVPWLVSNPITVGLPPLSAAEPPDEHDGLVVPTDLPSWGIEKDPVSTAMTVVDEAWRRFEFRLDPALAHGQYAALVTTFTNDQSISWIKFRGRASRPMRLSLQVRLLHAPADERWRRSVYLDEAARVVDVRLQDFGPVDGAVTRPVSAPLQALLLVVDTINTPPGTEGTVWVSDVSLGVAAPPK